MLYGWKENSMLTNRFAACAHLTITVSHIFMKKSFYHTPLHSTPPLGGFLSEYRYRLWYRKTRMVSLADGEKISKICLFVLTWSTNVTDERTDKRTDGHCMTAKTTLCIASRGKNGFTAHRCSDAWFYNGLIHWALQWAVETPLSEVRALHRVPL